METFQDPWWLAFGRLGLEGAVIVAAGWLASRRVRSAVWRRSMWQACLVGLSVALVVELCGGVPVLALRRPVMTPSAQPHLPARESVRDPVQDLQPVIGPGELVSTVSESGSHRSVPSPTPVGNQEMNGLRLHIWAIGIWIAGALLLVAKGLFHRGMLLALRCRSTGLQDADLDARLFGLRRRLKWQRRVVMFESHRLSSPVALGLWRPAIGLPRDFACRHTSAQQDVILLHELAHLAAGDPAWYGFADALTALLWWQPWVWWLRHQLRAASETAADEASLLVKGGPAVLAECLIELGRRLAGPEHSSPLGVGGSDYRSGLGRRVDRLLKLPARPWQPPAVLPSSLARTVAPAALALIVAMSVAWTFPQNSTTGKHMKHPLWKQSLAAAVAVVALAGRPEQSVAAETNLGIRPNAVTVAGGASPTERRAGMPLNTKLQTIMLDEVSYDSLPLGAVVEALIKEASRRDPEKVGVNFLMGKATLPVMPPPIDPATGLPIANPAPQEVDLNAVTIRIVPPLRKVRLIDVLDAITRVADIPIKYTVEEYAIVWTLAPQRPGGGFAQVPEPPPPAGATAAAPGPVFQARAFKLDTNTFFKSLEKTFHLRTENTSERVRGALSDVCVMIGTPLKGEKSIVFYNEITGGLFVRALADDMPAIQAVVEMLGAKPSAQETPPPPAARQ